MSKVLMVCFSSSSPHRAETADLKILIADSSLLTELLSEEKLTITLPDLAKKLLALQSSRYNVCSCCILHCICSSLHALTTLTLLPLFSLISTGSWTATALEAFNPEDTIIVLNKTDLLPHELIGRGLDKNIQV